MVRLKEIVYSTVGCIVLLFQFQNGAIKRLDTIGIRAVIAAFQFQNGAIKSFFVRAVITHLISIPKWCD